MQGDSGVNDSVTIAVPEPDYTLFTTSREGLPAIVVANGALLHFQHLDIFPWHLVVTIHADSLAEKGMPNADESALLFDIGDRIEHAIVGWNALFLSRVTWNGLRLLTYRVHDPDVAEKALNRLLEDEWHRQWEFRMEHDPDGDLAAPYFRLFPPTRRTYDA